jgi:hypothetical protein
VTSHDHPPDGDCQPSCPAWAEGALELAAMLHRHDAMLAACRAAERIEFVLVAPGVPETEVPEFLKGEDFVRLNLVVGRDCPEVLLDEWGIRVTLTFRGRRYDCALPWPSVRAGVLTAPKALQRKPRRFGVIDGGPEAAATPAPAAAPAEAPSPAATAEPTPPPAAAPAAARPRVPFGVIPGGKSER